MSRLRLLATYCNFNDGDSEIVRQVIQSCYSTTFRRKLLSKDDLDLEDLLSMGRVHDTIEAQAQIVECTINNDSIKQISNIKAKHYVKYNNPTQMNKSKNQNQFNYHNTTDKKCSNCGYNWHKEKTQCPARGKRCNYCGKPNHYASVCITRKKQKGVSETKKQYDPNANPKYLYDAVKKIDSQLNDDNDYIYTIQKDARMPSVDLEVQGAKVNFIIDKNKLNYKHNYNLNTKRNNTDMFIVNEVI